VADGADQVQVRVTVRDGSGKPVEGVEVELAATGTGNALVQPSAPTDSSGVAIGALATTVAEVKTLSATIAQGPLPAQATSAFSPGAPNQLAFVQQPGNADVNAILQPAVTVAIRDRFGNLTASTSTVSLSGASLRGTVAVAAAGGVAAFSDLSVDQPGTYRLHATSGSLSSADSAAFTIAPSTNDVTGTWYSHWVLDDGGTATLPADLSGTRIAAYVPDDAGSYTVIAGSGTDAGTFSIPGVPPGARYFLYAGGYGYLDTSARFIDFSTTTQGRPNVALASPGTCLANTITGMTPWTLDTIVGDADDIDLYSVNAGLFVNELEASYSAGVFPTQGDTVLSETTCYNQLPPGTLPVLMDASKGDQTYFMQLQIRRAPYQYDDAGVPVAWTAYHGLERVFGPVALTVVDQQTTPVSGAFSPAPQQSLALRWPMQETTPGSFDSFRAAVHPGAATYDHTLYFEALPSGAYGTFNSAPELLRAHRGTSGSNPPDDMAITYQYGDPFPPSWTRVYESWTGFQVPLSMTAPDGGTATTTVYSYMVARDLLSNLAGAPLQPQVSPVTGAEVDGTSILTPQTLASATPTIRWNPPVVGPATHYYVRIHRCTATSSGGMRLSGVAGFATRATQLKVPPGILQPGNAYQLLITITAFREPGKSVETAPLAFQFPSHSAETFSAVLTLP